MGTRWTALTLRSLAPLLIQVAATSQLDGLHVGDLFSVVLADQSAPLAVAAALAVAIAPDSSGFITGHNFFGPAGSPGDILLIRDVDGVRQLEALQIDNSVVTNAVAFGAVDTNENFVGSGDFNHDGLSDLLINVDNLATQTRAFLIDQMNPGGITAQSQIAVRGSDWVVDGIGDFNGNGTSDVLLHRDSGDQRTFEALLINNFAIQSTSIVQVAGSDCNVDATGDFNHDGRSEILEHRIVGGNMNVQVLNPNNGAVSLLANIGSDWNVDGTGDFNGDGSSDVLIHRDSDSSRTFEILTVNNNTVVNGTVVAVLPNTFQLDGIGDFNGDGTSDIAMDQDIGTTRNDWIFLIANNQQTNAHIAAATGSDWHVA
jgi:hypothetical protein